MTNSLGVAVIGAGMAGRAHAAAFHVAPTIYDPVLPPIRRVAIGDANPVFGQAAADRFGYERAETDWRAIAAAPDIDVVAVAVANSLHREMVEGLLAAGKHVLCEKPLADTIEDAAAMADAARDAETVARIGFTYRRMPSLAAVHQLVEDGTLGEIRHVSGRYICDYSSDPGSPWSWRFGGQLGSGALADVGSHLVYVAELVGGKTREVSGARFVTSIDSRPLPLGDVQGHEHAEVSDETKAVTNDDYATWTARLERAPGCFEVSRVAYGHPNGLEVEVYGENGAARWHMQHQSAFDLYLRGDPYGRNGFRKVYVGPEHPYLSGGQPMDAPGVGVGQNDAFVYQARAFLEEVAGIPEGDSLPRNASFDEGLRNMRLLASVAESAARDGAAVAVDKEETK